MMSYVRKCFSTHYAKFAGRASRSELNFFLLFLLLISGLQYLLWDSEGVSSILALVTLLPTISVFVRRAHDLALSAWWVLLYFSLSAVYIPGIFILTLCLESPELPKIEMAVILIVSVLAIILKLVLLGIAMLKRGTVGPNRYGEDPLVENMEIADKTTLS